MGTGLGAYAPASAPFADHRARDWPVQGLGEYGLAVAMMAYKPRRAVRRFDVDKRLIALAQGAVERAAMPTSATQAGMRVNNPGLPIRRFRKRVGRCYELAYAYIQDSDDASNCILVHGEAALGPDLVADHAWLRRGETVYDPVLDLYFGADEYADHYRGDGTRSVQQERGYAGGAAQGHYGPWHWGIFLPTGAGRAWLGSS
jgi:hypothetical protein